MGLIKKKKNEINNTIKVCPVCDFEYKGDYDTCPECGADLTGSSIDYNKNEEKAEYQNAIEEEFFGEEDFDEEFENFETGKNEEVDEIENIDDFLDGIDTSDNQFNEFDDLDTNEENDNNLDFVPFIGEGQTEGDIGLDFDGDGFFEEKTTSKEEVTETEEVSEETEEEDFEELLEEEPQTLLQQMASEKEFENVQIAELYATTQPEGTISDVIVARRLEDGKIDVIVGGNVPMKIIDVTDEEAELLRIDDELKTKKLTIMERAKRINRESELEKEIKKLFDVKNVSELNGITKAEVKQYVSVYKGLGDDFEEFDITLETASELSGLTKKDQKLVAETAIDMDLNRISLDTAKRLVKEEELNDVSVLKILSRDIKQQSNENLMEMIKEAVREIVEG